MHIVLRHRRTVYTAPEMLFSWDWYRAGAAEVAKAEGEGGEQHMETATAQT